MNLNGPRPAVMPATFGRVDHPASPTGPSPRTGAPGHHELAADGEDVHGLLRRVDAEPDAGAGQVPPECVRRDAETSGGGLYGPRLDVGADRVQLPRRDCHRPSLRQA